MDKIYEQKGTGANHSEVDSRTVLHENVSNAMVTAPVMKGGIEYAPADHEDQHAVGICTAISRVQLRQKQTGKRYSPDFQYLLQKKYYDGNWTEGSSILSANKVAKKYGFLPIQEFDKWITEVDRYLSYSAYIAKLQAIPQVEIVRLMNLCVDKIAGYAQVNASDPQLIAKAILSSPGQTGILCRYGCQKNWWTSPTGIVSWAAKDIDPLRWAPETSGHAIINSKFDYSNGSSMQKLANTWGQVWCLQGSADINWDNYPMTEAWVDLTEAPVIVQNPVLRLGAKGDDVKKLQTLLNAHNAAQLVVDGSFGQNTLKQVVIFQKANNLTADGVVGNQTWAKLFVVSSPAPTPESNNNPGSPSSGDAPVTTFKVEIENLAKSFMNKLITTSNGTGEVSATVKGLLLLMLPVLITIGNRYGIAFTQDNVMQAVSQASVIIGQIILVFGLVRKFYNWLKQAFKPTPPQV